MKKVADLSTGDLYDLLQGASETTNQAGWGFNIRLFARLENLAANVRTIGEHLGLEMLPIEPTAEQMKEIDEKDTMHEQIGDPLYEAFRMIE